MRMANEALTAKIGASRMPAPARNNYSVDHFASEVLCGNRMPAWVCGQCRVGKIRTVAGRPWITPQSESAEVRLAS